MEPALVRRSSFFLSFLNIHNFDRLKVLWPQHHSVGVYGESKPIAWPYPQSFKDLGWDIDLTLFRNFDDQFLDFLGHTFQL